MKNYFEGGNSLIIPFHLVKCCSAAPLTDGSLLVYFGGSQVVLRDGEDSRFYAEYKQWLDKG